jgi:hypothetical protein
LKESTKEDVKNIFRKIVEVELNSEEMKKYIVKRPGF